MPCDGVTVASFSVTVGNEILSSPVAIGAVVRLLQAKYPDCSLLSENEISVAGSEIVMGKSGVYGKAPAEVTNDVAKACKDVAAALAQQRLVEQVAANAQVITRTNTSNGAVVLRVQI